jgi:hypothetical protein
MYVTETLIRDRIAKLFAERAANTPKAAYDAWVESRIEDARKAKQLLTDQQFADQKRGLVVEDVVRYVGPTRLEPSPKTGRGVLRPTGQVGTITRVERTSTGWLYTFMPHVTAEARAYAETSDLEVLTLTTNDWTLFERIP